VVVLSVGNSAEDAAGSRQIRWAGCRVGHFPLGWLGLLQGRQVQLGKVRGLLRLLWLGWCLLSSSRVGYMVWISQQ
jgi:hypothetical protein